MRLSSWDSSHSYTIALQWASYAATIQPRKQELITDELDTVVKAYSSGIMVIADQICDAWCGVCWGDNIGVAYTMGPRGGWPVEPALRGGMVGEPVELACDSRVGSLENMALSRSNLASETVWSSGTGTIE